MAMRSARQRSGSRAERREPRSGGARSRESASRSACRHERRRSNRRRGHGWGRRGRGRAAARRDSAGSRAGVRSGRWGRGASHVRAARSARGGGVALQERCGPRGRAHLLHPQEVVEVARHLLHQVEQLQVAAVPGAAAGQQQRQQRQQQRRAAHGPGADVAGRAQLRRRGAGSRWALREAGGLGPVGSASPGPIAASAAPDVGCPGNGGAGAGRAVGAGCRGPSPSPSCLGLSPPPPPISPFSAGPREPQRAAAAGGENVECAAPRRASAPSVRVVPVPRHTPKSLQCTLLGAAPPPLRVSRAFLA